MFVCRLIILLNAPVVVLYFGVVVLMLVYLFDCALLVRKSKRIVRSLDRLLPAEAAILCEYNATALDIHI